MPILPIHLSQKHKFNYEEIDAGYYFKAMLEGGEVQKFWHQKKFLTIAEKISDQENVVDFGCGPGSFLYMLAKTNENVEATGVDISQNQINFANREVKSRLPKTKLNFIQSMAQKAPAEIQPATFDIATSIEVIEHIHPAQALKILEQMKKSIKPDGRVILTTPNYRSLWPFIELALNFLSPVKYNEQHISKFTPNSFAKFIEIAGLEVTKVSSIFILSPFLAKISKRLANLVYRLERKFDFLAGSLLIIEAKINHEI